MKISPQTFKRSLGLLLLLAGGLSVRLFAAAPISKIKLPFEKNGGLMISATATSRDTAKTAGKPAKKTTYLLPDGTVLGPAGLDSISKVWGKGRIAMQHSTEDDDKGVMHLVRITDEMAKQFADEAAKDEQTLKAMIGQQAPDFYLFDLKGKKWTLSELKGKIVVLNFWFTSCPPCLQEMPELNRLAQAYKPKDVVFLALTFNDDKNVNSFLNAHTFDYTILTDSHGIDMAYKISSWPTSIVIDKQGKIALAMGTSADIYKDLDAAIEKNL